MGVAIALAALGIVTDGGWSILAVSASLSAVAIAAVAEKSKPSLNVPTLATKILISCLQTTQKN